MNINIDKIYVKNTHFINRKYYITRIFIKGEFIFMYVQISKKFFIFNKPIENKLLENHQQFSIAYSCSYIY